MPEEFVLAGPGVETIAITREMYLAVRKMLRSTEKPNGAVTIHFKSGNIVGVIAETKETFK